MSSELIGELGQVVGMGIDEGLVHSEVVVMGEEMVVSSGTVVYQEDVPGIITRYNGNVLLPDDTTEIVSSQNAAIDGSVGFEATEVPSIDQEIIVPDIINPEEVVCRSENFKKIRKIGSSINNRISLEELGCHDNNTVVEEEVCCQEGENVSEPTKMESSEEHSMEQSTNESNPTQNKSYALPPDPGTATRRGGPGPTKRQSQRYRKAWELLPEFKNWLCSHHNVYRAICKICNKVLLADFTVLKAHVISRKHALLADRIYKAKHRLSSITSREEECWEDAVDNITITSDSGAVSGGAGSDSNFKEEYETKFSDPINKGNNGAGGGGSGTQAVENSEGNYSTGIYVPQPRTPSVQLVSKAVVMSPAPNWKATAIVNGHVTRLDLSDYVGRYLILVFYPQDFSKICASEINALSDRSFEFRSIQTEIVACSVDSHLAHLTWSKLSRADGGVSLPKIPLLADPTHTIAKAYGVLLPDKGHTLRAHFIIDKRGILRHMSVTDTLVGRGTDELFRLVKALQYVDEVEEPVPADWTQSN